MKNLGSQLQKNFEHALKCKYACWINKEYKLEERNIYIRSENHLHIYKKEKRKKGKKKYWMEMKT